jgi:transcriptional regulator with XRE-family HTH domain
MQVSALNKNLGAVVRQRRLALGMSQDAFAARAGVHRTYMGGVERGERNVSLANLRKIALALEAPLSTLFLEAEALAESVRG